LTCSVYGNFVRGERLGAYENLLCHLYGFYWMLKGICSTERRAIINVCLICKGFLMI